MQMMKIEDLKPHKRNSEFFDDMTGEKWQEFLDSIKTSGVIEPIVVTQDKVIVSGHQRVRACKELGIKEVWVEVRIYDNDVDVLKDMLLDNLQNDRLRFMSKRKKINFILSLEELGLIKDDSQKLKEEYRQHKNQLRIIRNEIIKQRQKCDICNMNLTAVLEIYHLINLSEHGNNDDDNILCLCPNCRTMLYKVTHGKTKEDEIYCSKIYSWALNNLSFRSYEKFRDCIYKYIRVKTTNKKMRNKKCL